MKSDNTRLLPSLSYLVRVVVAAPSCPAAPLQDEIMLPVISDQIMYGSEKMNHTYLPSPFDTTKASTIMNGKKERQS